MYFFKKSHAYWPLVAFLAACLLAACAPRRPDIPVAGGDPDRGAQAIQRHGCPACHNIPGIRGADSYVGPPLIAWSERSYIAGALPNTPDNLIFWIMEPQSVEPGTAMPDMGIGEQEARDIAAYLFRLRPGGLSLFARGGQEQ